MRLADLPNDGSQQKEIYAVFGLAMYHAAVFEVAVVNAIVPFKIAMEQGSFKTREEFHRAFDEEMAQQYKEPLGNLLKTLGRVHNLPKALGGQFHKALNHRNLLAHHFFRENAESFYSLAGREEMYAYLLQSTAMFESTIESLYNFLQPKLDAVGVTKERLAKEFRQYMREVKDRCGASDEELAVDEPD